MSGERTEAATPKRLSTLRGDGTYARSQELGPAIGLLVALVILQSWAANAVSNMQGLLVGTYADLGELGRADTADLPWAAQTVGKISNGWLGSVMPLLVALPLLAIVVGLAQSGGLVSFKVLYRPGSLNPIAGMKRFVSMQAWIQLGRSLFKVIVVGAVTWHGLQDTATQLPHVDGTGDPRILLGFIGSAVLNIGMPVAETLLGLSLADYGYQRWHFARSSRMSRQDVKDEAKQGEGDPHIKGRIRARQRQMARRRRQLEDVPKATVVITNPTHIAIALQYEASMSSPRVLAVGADLVAQKIRDVARIAGVPMVENIPLARGLYTAVDVGDEIPVELYGAVAEVLAYVYNLKRSRRRPDVRPRTERPAARY
ncbi:MAG: flagellar biosynthesis protein FlhB [Chloroflexota bacterium]